MEFSFILSMTKLRNKKSCLIIHFSTSVNYFLLMLQVLILNPVLMKKVADHLPCYYTKYISIK